MESETFQRMNPNHSLQTLKQRLPYKDEAVLEDVLAAFGKVGLKRPHGVVNLASSAKGKTITLPRSTPVRVG